MTDIDDRITQALNDQLSTAADLSHRIKDVEECLAAGRRRGEVTVFELARQLPHVVGESVAKNGLGDWRFTFEVPGLKHTQAHPCRHRHSPPRIRHPGITISPSPAAHPPTACGVVRVDRTRPSQPVDPADVVASDWRGARVDR